MTARTPRTADQPAPDEVRLGRGRPPQARALRAAREALYREHIMAVAEKIFAEQGFANTRIQDIAAAAGISLATLYQSYPSKQELHRALLIERDRQMLGLVMEETRVSDGMPESLEQLLLFQETHLHFLLDHPDYLRMQLQEGHAWYHNSAQPTHAEQQMWEQGLAFLEQVLRWGMDEGLFSPGDPRHQGRMLLALQQTRLANWVMDGMREAHEDVIRRIQVDFIRLFCPPETIRRHLDPSGAGLHSRTLKAVRALAAERQARRTAPEQDKAGRK
jgi:AcrR family transcriptional regulator